MDHGDWVSGWDSPRKAAHWFRPSLCFPPGFPFQLTLPSPLPLFQAVAPDLSAQSSSQRVLGITSSSSVFPQLQAQRVSLLPAVTSRPRAVLRRQPKWLLSETELLGSLEVSFTPSSYLCQFLCPRGLWGETDL